MIENYEGDVRLVGVAGRDDLDAIADFIGDQGVDGIDHIADESGEVWNHFGVAGQPAWVFVNDTGEASLYYGRLGTEGLIAQADELAAS